MLWMIPTMIPKMPSANAKISTMRIFTKRDEEQRERLAIEKPNRPYALYAIVPSMYKRAEVGSFFLSVYGQGPKGLMVTRVQIIEPNLFGGQNEIISE